LVSSYLGQQLVIAASFAGDLIIWWKSEPVTLSGAKMTQMLSNLFRRSLALLTIGLILAVFSAQALAQDGATVYLQQIEAADGILTVDVIAENVTDMYGAEFHLKYDPQMVSVQDANPNQQGVQIQPGTLLAPEKGFVVANTVNEAEGTVGFALTLLNPAPPVTGSGPLARVTFNVLQSGPVTIEVERAKLVAIDLQTIPSQTVPLVVDKAEQVMPASGPEQIIQPEVEQPQPDISGQVVTVETDTTTATANADFPWWIVAATIMILGIVGLGALVLLSGLGGSQNLVQPQSSPNPPRQQSQRAREQPDPSRSGHVSGTRPSAFK
jgi:hypothetical protein